MTNMSQIVGQLRAEQHRLARQITTITSVLKTLGKASPNGTRVRRLSAAGRISIAAAQKARWAKVRAKNRKVVTIAKRSTLSAAARAKIAAAQRARWARVKAEDKAA